MEVVEFTLGDGSRLLAEVEASQDYEPSGPGPWRPRRAEVSVEDALQEQLPAVKRILGLLDQISPSETEIEFGIQLSGQAGAIFVRGSVEATFLVRAKWIGERP